MVKAKTFKNLILLQTFLTILFVVKLIDYPYSLAPEDFKKAMIAYDELQPVVDNFSFIFMILVLILLIVSLIKLYQFKKLGRTLFLISTIGSFLTYFISSYFVYDSIEIVLELGITLLTGFILGISYYSNLKKSFK